VNSSRLQDIAPALERVERTGRSLPILAAASSHGRILLAAIVVGYGILGLWLLAPEAVYTGDIGVKYVQARALASHGFSSLDLPYPGEFMDPGREFFPFRPPFIMTAGGSTQTIFPPVATVIQAVAARAAGIRGLILVSIVSAGVILWAAWKLTPAPNGRAVLVALGLGGPLWFYAVCGMEHAPAVALSTAAFVAARGGARLSPAFAGALVGAAATLRDESLLVLPGLLFALWIWRRDVRSLVVAVAAAIVPLLLAAALEVWWFDRPAAAHLRHAVHILQVALRLTSEPNPEVPVLRPFTISDRYETVVNYWLAGSSQNAVLAVFAAGFLAALAVRWRWRTSAGLVVWLVGVMAVAAVDLHEVLTAPKWLAGLFRVAPYLAVAFFPAPPGAARQTWPRVALLASVAFIALAFAGVDTTGGKSLGPRLLLPIVPFLTIAAVVRTGQYLEADRRLDRLVGFAGAALVLSSVAFHLGGTIPAYRMRNADDSSAVLAAAAAPARVVVADDPFTAQLLFPLYYQKIVLLADSPALGGRLGTVLADQRVPRVVLVSRDPSPVVTLPPLQLERTEQQGRMVIQHWRR
jgi:hypothetical protein